MPIFIRDARVPDGSQVMKIWKEGLDYHAALSKSDFALDEDAPRFWTKSFNQNLKRKDVKLLVAVKNRAITGYLLGQAHRRPRYFKTKRCGFIGELAVTKKERGKGTGKLLLKAFLDWADQKGLPYVNLFVDSRNLAGRGFWKKAGFETIMLEQRKITNCPTLTIPHSEAQGHL